MGMCSGKFKLKNDPLFSSMFRALEEKDTKTLTTIIHRRQSSIKNFDIDDRFICIKDTYISLLTYALTNGDTESFITLVEKGKASLKQLKTDLSEIGLSPVDIICDLDLVDLLKYYLPIHMSHYNSEESIGIPDVEDSLFADWAQIAEQSRKLKIKHPKTPLQNACERGSFKIVQFIDEYFQGKQVPTEFDFHFVSESTGENTALCSVKSGNLPLVRFLFEYVHVNFQITNKYRENALMIACVWSKRKSTDFLEIVRYLVEVASIDLIHIYEEALLVLNDPDIISYIEQKLKEVGINDTKELVDKRNRIHRTRRDSDATPPTKDMEFDFKEYFYKHATEDSRMSSIHRLHSHSHFFSKAFDP